MAHVYKIRHGIETAVSVPVVVSENVDQETGENVQHVEEQVYLPGAVIEGKVADYFVEKIEDEDDHVSSLIEVVEVADKPKPAATKTAPKKPEAKASAAAKKADAGAKSDGNNPFTSNDE